jgi:hypothetical protein
LAKDTCGLSKSQNTINRHPLILAPGLSGIEERERNELERLNQEVKRRTKVVEIFPEIPSTICLVGALLTEANDEWQIRRRFLSKESMS